MLMVLYTTVVFNQNLIGFQLKSLPGTLFTNYLAIAVADIPAHIVAALSAKRFGVRYTFIAASFISFIGASALIFLDPLTSNYILIMAMIILYKVGMAACFSITYFANSRLFPVIYATTVFGLCNVVAKLATVGAPLLAEVDQPYPEIVSMAICGFISFSAYFLKEETHHK